MISFSDVDDYLIVAVETELRSLHLDPAVRSVPVPPVRGLTKVTALAYDYANKMLYFTQVSVSVISRVPLGSKTVEDIVVRLNKTSRKYYDLVLYNLSMVFDINT